MHVDEKTVIYCRGKLKYRYVLVLSVMVMVGGMRSFNHFAFMNEMAQHVKGIFVKFASLFNG